MKKLNRQASGLTRKRNNGFRTDSVDLDEIDVEFSEIEEDFFAGIKPYNQMMVHRHFFKKIYEKYFQNQKAGDKEYSLPKRPPPDSWLIRRDTFGTICEDDSFDIKNG